MNNATNNNNDGLKALIWIICLFGIPTILYITGLVVNPIIIKAVVGLIFVAPLFFINSNK